MRKSVESEGLFTPFSMKHTLCTLIPAFCASPLRDRESASLRRRNSAATASPMLRISASRNTEAKHSSEPAPPRF